MILTAGRTFYVAPPFDGPRSVLELLHKGSDGLVNPLLDGDGVRAGGDAQQSQLDDFPRENGGGGSPIAGRVVGFAGDLYRGQRRDSFIVHRRVRSGDPQARRMKMAITRGLPP